MCDSMYSLITRSQFLPNILPSMARGFWAQLLSVYIAVKINPLQRFYIIIGNLK